MPNMLISMRKKTINRIKVVLAEQGRTNKWLSEQLGMNETTISRWCTNERQPSLETLVVVASVLRIDIKELLHSTPTNIDRHGESDLKNKKKI